MECEKTMQAGSWVRIRMFIKTVLWKSRNTNLKHCLDKYLIVSKYFWVFNVDENAYDMCVYNIKKLLADISELSS